MAPFIVPARRPGGPSYMTLQRGARVLLLGAPGSPMEERAGSRLQDRTRVPPHQTAVWRFRPQVIVCSALKFFSPAVIVCVRCSGAG